MLVVTSWQVIRAEEMVEGKDRCLFLKNDLTMSL